MLVGLNCTNFDILMIEIELQCYLSEAFFANYLFMFETVLIENVVGAVVEIICTEMKTLRFVPIW